MDVQYTNVVEVFNRSNRKVEFTWDGRQFEVPPKGRCSMIEPAAWHGRKVTVYNLSVYSLVGVPVLGIVGIHDHELHEELPDPSKTGEIIDREEIVKEQGGRVEVAAFSAGPMVEPKVADSGRVVFSSSPTPPFTGHINVVEE